MATKRTGGLTFNTAERNRLYGMRHVLGLGLEEKLGLRIPFDVYFQDPLVAKQSPHIAFDTARVEWEPGLADGPTSARFAVVDYNGDTGVLIPPAKWLEKKDCFVDKAKKALNKRNKKSMQFHQVNVWALLQRALDFYESRFGLGRRIPWGFEGSRLLVVPHAGYGENAFYDRQSKSLQFYYFGEDKDRTYTCLSTDIVNHEFGHAILDGIRPYYIEAQIVETGAFHEFVGDLTAILIAFRNNPFRNHVADDTGGDLSDHNLLSSLAVQFGTEVTGKPYLRSGLNQKKMSDVAGTSSPHLMSQVLTGAMYDIIRALTHHYIEVRERSLNEAFWHTIQRMQRMAIQPLDLLPPVDVTFRDYALAVLRTEEIANPVDPHGIRPLILKAFVDRKILSRADAKELKTPDHVFDRLRLSVLHRPESIGSSRASAYRFLDDNRRDLFIPTQVDLIVADVYTAEKFGRQASKQPKQLIVQYIWREDVLLDGERFEEYNGQMTTMLCGGTLVLDEDSNVVSWVRKPGSTPLATRRGKAKEVGEQEEAEGRRRRDELLEVLVDRIRAGMIGAAPGSARGLLGTRVPPITANEVDGVVRFELTPHMRISEDDDADSGGRQWEISS